MNIALWFLFSFGFLHLCSAQDIVCTVTDDADQTTYSISDVSGVKASNCEYSWTYNRVLANHKEKIPEVVTTNSINTLVTSKCFDKIFYELNCVLEGHHTANCTTNCTQNALRRSQKDREISQNNNSNWIVVVVVVVVIILALVLGFLCCKIRDKTRMCSCSQHKWFYTAVKMQKGDPKADDVEAGKE